MKKIKSIFVVLIFMFIGGFLGYFLPFINDRVDFHIDNLGILAWLPVFLLFILTIFCYYSGKKIVKKGIENDDAYDKANQLLCLAGGCVGLILPFLMVGMVLAFVNLFEMKTFMILLQILIMAFFACIQIYLHKKIIDVVKIIAPEKKGDVFDSKFAKDWVSSMDEAELSQMYQSGYCAFRNMNSVYVVVLFILFILSSANIVDMWFPLTVGFLWILQYAFYFNHAYRMEHCKKKVIQKN